MNFEKITTEMILDVAVLHAADRLDVTVSTVMFSITSAKGASEVEQLASQILEAPRPEKESRFQSMVTVITDMTRSYMNPA